MAGRRRRWWWLVGLTVLVGATASGFLLSDSSLTVLFVVAAVFWCFATGVWLSWRLWRWLTYRVAVRLFVSYLLLGITPFVACGIFGLVALYMMMGQFLSVQFGHTIDQTAHELATIGRSVLSRSAANGSAEALGNLKELASKGAGPFASLLWAARLNDVQHTSADWPVDSVPDWLWGHERASVVHHDGQLFVSITARDALSSNAIILLGQLDADSASKFSEDQWYQVAFIGGMTHDPDLNLQLSASEGGADVLVKSGNTVDKPDKLWGRWTAPVAGLLTKPWIVWFKLPRKGVLELQTGELTDDPLLLMLLRSSPRHVWQNFTASSYELAAEIQGALIAVAVFFLVVYAVAVLVSGSMILSITRATTRLTRGARAVGQGDLSHRVPVRRHDQLGELADGFNRMAASVQDMLEEVKEKERLAQEMELARQIQESLLPAASQRHGPFAVYATFHPAAAVGGDAFDVFAPADERLQVMVADVAGHGLSTGLLMASLKATVATLLDEGYSGRDLVQRVNRSMLKQQRHRTMATLAVIDANAERNRLHLVNAGHTPPYLIGPDGSLRELMAGSLPLGTRLCRPSTLESHFSPGSRVVLYSDGLVEAEDRDGEIFGFDRLQELLGLNCTLDSAAMLASMVEKWRSWLGGMPARDDMTIVILERSHDV